MFKKEYVFTVESANTISLLRLLGKYGFKFDVSKEYIGRDPTMSFRELRFRKVTVYASPFQMKKYKDTVKLLAYLSLGISS